MLRRSDETKLQFNTFVLWLVFISIIAMIPRYFGLSHITADIEACLLPWSAEVPAYQGIGVLLNFTGDYNMPYVTVLWLLNFLPGETLLKVKIFSMIFDYLCAVVAGRLVMEFVGTAKDVKFLITYALVLFYPVSVMNSAWWGQCDFVYVTFVLLALLALKRGRYHTAMIWMGFAFSFKLQTIIIVPFILTYLWKKHEFKLRYFLWIPLVMEILCIPAMIAGYSPLIPFSIYLRQFGRYPYMYVFYPNFWALFPEAQYYIFGTATQLAIFLALLLMVGLVIRQKEDISEEHWLAIAVWSTLLLMAFLPCMHERYGLLLEILAILYAVVRPRRFWLPLIICAGITVSYLQVTFAQHYFSDQWIAAAMLLCLGFFTYALLYDAPRSESALYSRALEVITEGERGIYRINRLVPLLAIPVVLGIGLFLRYRMLECMSADYLPNLIEVDGNHHTGFYMWIMTLLSRFDEKPLFFLTKVLVALFDILAAGTIGALMALWHDRDAIFAVKNMHRTASLEERKRMGSATADTVYSEALWKAVMFAGLYLILPTTLMNSSIWAHFDSLCLFFLASAGLLYRKNTLRCRIIAGICAGIAVAILPQYLILVVAGGIILNIKYLSGRADRALTSESFADEHPATSDIRMLLIPISAFIMTILLLSLTGLSVGYSFRSILERLNFFADLHTYTFFFVLVALLVLSFRRLLYLIPLTLFTVAAILDWGQFLYEEPVAPSVLIIPLYILGIITAIAVDVYLRRSEMKK